MKNVIGLVDHLAGHSQASGDGQRVGLSRNPHREPIGRRQRLNIELDAGVLDAGSRIGVGLDL